MAVIQMTHQSNLSSLGKAVSFVLKASRVAFLLLGPVGLMLLAILGCYAVLDYFHGDEQTLRALWNAVRH
jgi:hypothetical protein